MLAGVDHSGGAGEGEAGVAAEGARVVAVGVEVFLVVVEVLVEAELLEVGDAYADEIFFDGA